MRYSSVTAKSIHGELCKLPEERKPEALKGLTSDELFIVAGALVHGRDYAEISIETKLSLIVVLRFVQKKEFDAAYYALASVGSVKADDRMNLLLEMTLDRLEQDVNSEKDRTRASATANVLRLRRDLETERIQRGRFGLVQGRAKPKRHKHDASPRELMEELQELIGGRDDTIH